jgi:hypothetical protein
LFFPFVYSKAHRKYSFSLDDKSDCSLFPRYIYRKILELRPTWIDEVKAVMTGSNNYPEE